MLACLPAISLLCSTIFQKASLSLTADNKYSCSGTCRRMECATPLCIRVLEQTTSSCRFRLGDAISCGRVQTLANTLTCRHLASGRREMRKIAVRVASVVAGGHRSSAAAAAVVVVVRGPRATEQQHCLSVSFSIEWAISPSSGGEGQQQQQHPLICLHPCSLSPSQGIVSRYRK